LQGGLQLCAMSTLVEPRRRQERENLAGKALTVLIADQAGACAVNPVNPSLLTCTAVAPLAFPMRVVVELDGAVVNDFTWDGLGCPANS
jgi:hypothetical protein